MANIENSSSPSIGSTAYQGTIENSFNAVDAHDHSLNKGLPVARVHIDALDDTTVGLDGDNKLYVKLASLTEAKFGSGVASPAGTIIAFTGTSAPSGWLICDGSAVSRATYAGLFAVLSTSWGQGDNATTFNIPDMRGVFLRGRANGSTNDSDRATRTALATGGATGDNVGSYQADAIAQHLHTAGYQSWDASGSPNTSGATEEGRVLFGTGSTEQTNIFSTAVTNGATTSTETRPNNVYFNYIVKT